MELRAKAFLQTSEDQTFCELLLYYVQQRNITGEALEEAVKVLYEPWILTRLAAMRRSTPAIFFGSFLGPLRRRYATVVFVGDLFAAMGHTMWESQGEGGDVPPNAFVDAGLAYYEHGGSPGTYPGWHTLAQHYTIRRGEFTVVTGIASHMKSQFVQALCVNLARDAGWKIGLFSPEHYPVGHLARGLIENYANFRMADMPLEMFRDTMEWVADHFHPIVAPLEVPPTLAWILGVARHQVTAYGLNGLVIDPWNEVENHVRGEQTETHYISEALSVIRRFARHHNLHVWVVAHPRKMQKDLTGDYKGKYPPPKPYDISDSAHWYNKADNCLCIWRDVWEDSAEIEVHVQKVRNRAVGYPGLVHLSFTGHRFVEQTAEEIPAWRR